MDPRIATIVYRTMIVTLTTHTKRFLGFRTVRYAMMGMMKSRGVKPIAPQRATKSPKNGMAAAMRVIMIVYTVVTPNLDSPFRRLKGPCLGFISFSSK